MFENCERRKLDVGKTVREHYFLKSSMAILCYIYLTQCLNTRILFLYTRIYWEKLDKVYMVYVYTMKPSTTVFISYHPKH